MCTNVHPVYTGETVLRWKKTDAGWQKLAIPRPTAVGEYNKYMGGVDTSDQMLGTNSVHRRTKRWYITVFQHLVDIAVTNSFVIHKELALSQWQKPMTRQAFQEQLCAKLLGVPLAGGPKPTIPSQNHFAVPTSARHEMGKNTSLGRRKCVVCKKCTPWQCERCHVGLCLQVDRNCFREFHQGPQTPGHWEREPAGLTQEGQVEITCVLE